MRRDIINLTEDGKATLELVDLPLFEEKMPWIDKKKPAILVVPGGSYLYCSDREGLPVAYNFLVRGYQTFVLNYHVGEEAEYPQVFTDMARAVKYIKAHADELGIDKNEISAVGFSAGGHLVGTYGALIDNKQFQEDMGMTGDELRIKNILLGYPAISLGPIVEGINKLGAFHAVGKIFRNYEEIKDGYAMAHKDMPRTFIFHSLDDDLVPAGKVVEYVQRLVDIGVDVEFHLLNKGGHGFSTGDNLTNHGRDLPVRISSWIDACDKWIKETM